MPPSAAVETEDDIANYLDSLPDPVIKYVHLNDPMFLVLEKTNLRRKTNFLKQFTIDGYAEVTVEDGSVWLETAEAVTATDLHGNTVVWE